MEKIKQKNGGNQNNYATLNAVKKPSVIVTAAVIGASLLGVLRPSEKPAQAQINPIVAGVVQGLTYGLENGVNYEIARHVGGFYNQYGGGYYGGSYPTYEGSYPTYVTPFNGYNAYPTYVSPFNGYNSYPTYVSPYNGYNSAPTYVSPYGGTEGSYPTYQGGYPTYVSPYNSAPVYVPPVQTYVAPQYVPQSAYSAPTYNYQQSTVQPQTVYQQQTVQMPAPVTVEPLPQSKVVMSWPEKEAITLQNARRVRMQEELAAEQKMLQQQEAVLAKNAENKNSTKNSKSLSVSVEKDTFKNKNESIIVQKESIREKVGKDSTLIIQPTIQHQQLKLLKRKYNQQENSYNSGNNRTVGKTKVVQASLENIENPVVDVLLAIAATVGAITYGTVRKLKEKNLF